MYYCQLKKSKRQALSLIMNLLHSWETECACHSLGTFKEPLSLPFAARVLLLSHPFLVEVK